MEPGDPLDTLSQPGADQPPPLLILEMHVVMGAASAMGEVGFRGTTIEDV